MAPASAGTGDAACFGGVGWVGAPPVGHSVGLLSLYGALDSHTFVPSHVALGRCFLSAAAAGAPAGVVAAFAEPPPPPPPHAIRQTEAASRSPHRESGVV